MNGNTPSDGAWVAALLALDGRRLGGAIIDQDHANDWLAGFRTLLGPDTAIRDIPASVSDERLLGSIDIAATLAAGSPVHDAGLLAQQGTFILRGAERITTERASLYSAAIDELQSAVIACESAIDAEEGIPEKLVERLAFRLAGGPTGTFSPSHISAARNHLKTLYCTDDQITAICHTALVLGITSPRAPLQAVAAACALAALASRSAVTEHDATEACRLVFAHRAKRFPDEEQDQPEEPQQQTEADATDDSPRPDPTPEDMQDVILEAIKTALPPHLLQLLQSSEGHRSAGRTARGETGRKAIAKRGRSIGSKRGSPTRGMRLDLVATLRAAVLFQPFRKRFASRDGLIVTRDDFRVKRIKQRSETTAIFVVDASGSAALQRLGEAKGAVELILADCYVRRDKAALIAFRGKGAEQLLPPTRSLERAKRALSGLPGGGGTPIALGLDASLATALQVRRTGGRPIVILLTDGRANVTRNGEGSRTRAMEEALSAGRTMAGLRIQSLMIDVSPEQQPAARALAHAMAATYIALPRAGSAAIAAPVAAALRQNHS
jgi:magnesium chelatase subunit D